MQASQDGADWLVGKPSQTELFSALWLGSAGLLVLGLQPILLGAMFAEARVTFDELALAATLEIITLGVGSALAALLLASRHLRMKAVVLLGAVAVLNYLTGLSGSATSFIAIRGLCGLLEGGLVALATELIARSRRPERIGGYFITLQTVAQCLLAVLLSLWIIPAYGSAGGFDVLAVTCLLSLACVSLAPDRYAAMPAAAEGTAGGGIGVPAILALLAIFSFFLFIGAIWAFLEPIGVEAGIPVQRVGLMVSASLAVQVAGAAIATIVAGRLDYRIAIAASGLAGLVVTGLLAETSGEPMFWCAVLLTGFIWLFVTPYQIRLTIVADESRRTALLVPAAQLLGAALGPVGATLFIHGADVRAVPLFSAACLVVSLAFLGVFMRMPARTAGTAGRADA